MAGHKLSIGFLSVSMLLLSTCQESTPISQPVDDPEITAPQPVIWSVTDEDSEVILYPTFHILPQNIKWQSPILMAALTRADEIWYEVPADTGRDPAFKQQTMALGLSPDRPLSSVLPDATYAKLSNVMRELGMPENSLDPMRPWMASMAIPLIQMSKSGYDPELGVESVLQQIVTNKPVRSFETGLQQLQFLADIPEAEQIAMLDATLDDINEGQSMIDSMAKAWATGDLEFLQSEILDEMKAESPEVYNIMIKKRNQAWLDILVNEMQGAGVDFVAVGAGHLIGEDGLPEQLLQKGYNVKIITPPSP
ncbi:hypothetical protein DES40_2148 [Litorimonas taeanensis]|uniref:TraB family protein n=1 Tax=Litorimonas taeanensis TaxID=568099 RepID=A0A420WED8_9PROT|nr:TraB/GumN family protein [Litorimonas taeanensis]RKQ69348.1 hypothetical protein DES40_2148 [Litorimonas taeanensis]